MRHKIGDIVKISKSSRYYAAYFADPKDIEGKVIHINYNWIKVFWDNKKVLEYRENDLRLVRRPE